MEPKWTSKATSDLARIYEFLAPVNKASATGTIQALVVVPERLLQHPRLGERLDQFNAREVRRILVGQYEMRYEISRSTMYPLRVSHAHLERILGLGAFNDPYAWPDDDAIHMLRPIGTDQIDCDMAQLGPYRTG